MKRQDKKTYIQDLQLERVFLAIPGNVVKMIVKVEGKVDLASLETALHKTCLRHPILQSRIIMRQDGSAYFTSDGINPVTVDLIKMEDADDYSSIFHTEDSNPLDLFNSPPMRVLLLHKGSTSEIILYVNHTVCDGRSLVYVTRDLMDYLANPEKEVAALTPVETGNLMPDFNLNPLVKWVISKFNQKWESKKISFGQEVFREAWLNVYQHRDNFLHLNFTIEDTNALKQKCRENKVTVNSAILTAALLAKSQVPQLAFLDQKIISFAVDIREKMSPNPGEACSFYATRVNLKTKPSQNLSFWNNAFKIHQQSEQALNNNQEMFGRLKALLLANPAMQDATNFTFAGLFHDPLTDKVCRRMRKNFPDIMVTNLGGLTIPIQYGGYKIIDAIFIPPAVHAQKMLLIGASGIAGKMNITIPYYEKYFSADTMKNFKDSIAEALSKAASV